MISLNIEKTLGFISKENVFAYEAQVKAAQEALENGTGKGNDFLGWLHLPSSITKGLCAERTTLFYANSQYPDQPVVTLAIAARTEKDFIDHPIPPCGACRQVILETEKRYKQPIRILLYGKECIYEVKSIGDLLPLSFDASAMED